LLKVKRNADWGRSLSVTYLLWR